jgi:hypothetical protein
MTPGSMTPFQSRSFRPPRPRRPPLTELLVNSRPEVLEAAYDHSYTMPQVVRLLGLHPSTITRRPVRLHAQIKT